VNSYRIINKNREKLNINYIFGMIFRICISKYISFKILLEHMIQSPFNTMKKKIFSEIVTILKTHFHHYNLRERRCIKKILEWKKMSMK